jgi:hypothetical protein
MSSQYDNQHPDKQPHHDDAVDCGSSHHVWTYYQCGFLCEQCWCIVRNWCTREGCRACQNCYGSSPCPYTEPVQPEPPAHNNGNGLVQPDVDEPVHNNADKTVLSASNSTVDTVMIIEQLRAQLGASDNMLRDMRAQMRKQLDMYSAERSRRYDIYAGACAVALIVGIIVGRYL